MMLELKNVTKHFGGVAAVSKVSFCLPEGIIMGLIGPNGAGKTTLVNLVSGMESFGSGQILFRNQDISRKPAHYRSAIGIARSFQNIRLFGEMNVMDNALVGRHLKYDRVLRYFGWLFPWNRHKLDKQEKHCLHIFQHMDMDTYADKIAFDLSYGEQRKVELARALATEPTLLLLDEPTAGMNRLETDNIAQKILQLRDNGMTILVIEHDMDLINRVCDKVVVLNFGSLIAHDTPEVIRSDKKVVEAYLGRE